MKDIYFFVSTNTIPFFLLLESANPLKPASVHTTGNSLSFKVVPFKTSNLNFSAHPPAFLTVTLILFASLAARGQMITGVWKGKLNRQKAEIKIIQRGDSLTGTAYYYESARQYRRYSIKGYFDADTREAVWWDDQLLDEQPGRSATPGRVPMLSRADFNCPGENRMLLDGTANPKGNERPGSGEVHLSKTGAPIFPDEWDFVLENYTAGANDPYIIDSIGLIAQGPPPTVPTAEITAKPVTAITAAPPPLVVKPAPELTIEEKFSSRRKMVATEIPVSGDTIELRFYDHAEIDGDSISLFLNGRLLYTNIRLLGTAFVVRLPVNELQEVNELTMVAENLGTIPPNTSYMVATVEEKRYEARLESTEGSSAVIRLLKKQ
mgnify:CR=1 FL=1